MATGDTGKTAGSSAAPSPSASATSAPASAAPQTVAAQRAGMVQVSIPRHSFPFPCLRCMCLFGLAAPSYYLVMRTFPAAMHRSLALYLTVDCNFTCTSIRKPAFHSSSIHILPPFALLPHFPLISSHPCRSLFVLVSDATPDASFQADLVQHLLTRPDLGPRGTC